MGVRETEMSFSKQLSLSVKSHVAKALGLVPLEILRKAQRSLMIDSASEIVGGGRIRDPDWDYEKLLGLAETTWILRTIFDAIIREACGQGWGKDPRFVAKCTNPQCGQEFETETNPCTTCNHPTREPDAAEGVLLDRFMANPNPDHELAQILKSLMWQALAVDDWFLSVTYAEATVGTDPVLGEPVKVRKAKEIWVEDSAAIKIMANKRGQLGSDQFFCPTCYDDNESDVYYGKDQAVCPTCGSSLLETAYVQVLQGKITARFSKDEIIHNNGGKNLPRLFGKPKLISLLRLVLAMTYLDRYNLSAYSTGSLKSILAFPEMNQPEIDEMYHSIEAQLTAFKVDPETGESVRPNRSLWIGAKQAPQQLAMLPPSKDMQAIEWYKIYREAIASVYSVTPVFISIIESGRTGNNPEMQIDVMNRATKEWQQNFEDPFNNQVLPIFGIHDWVWSFNSIEADDALRIATVSEMKAKAAGEWATAGFQVTLDDEGELVISGQAGPPAQPATAPPLQAMEKMVPPIPATGARAGQGSGAHHSGGGKRHHVSLLKSLMPEHVDTYVEPFAGSAALFFSLTPPPKNATLNDINPEFATVWNWIKTATPQEIADLRNRKWSATRNDFFYAKDKYKPKTPTDYIWQIIYVSRHSFRRNRRSWRGELGGDTSRNKMPHWLENVDQYKKQLANAEVTVGDWKQTLKVHDSPTTFFYIDPPYDVRFAQELLQVLPTIKGQWLLSFGHHPQLEQGIRKAGFNAHTILVRNQLRGGASPVANPYRRELIAANYPINVPRNTVVKAETS
jgi:DNA adenine methylase